MDENTLDAVTSLGLLRAAYGALEKADPKCPEARAMWHEAMQKLNRAILLQWQHIDTLPVSASTSEEK